MGQKLIEGSNPSLSARFSVRDMPLGEALRVAAARLTRRGFGVHDPEAEAGETKLLVRDDRIEVNFVMRGTVNPVRRVSLVPAAREQLLAAVELPMVSLEDLYAGEICAALDRQHPRDLFDVMQLYANEGTTCTTFKPSCRSAHGRRQSRLG